MVCLDTSFIIDVLRGNEVVKKLKDSIDIANEAISVAAPTIMELVKGAYLSNKPDLEKQKILNFLSSLIALNLNKESAILAGEIEANLTQQGEIIELEDIMISAIVIANEETLITRNKKHFDKIKNLKTLTY